MGDGSGMNVEENLNRLDEVHIAVHLIHKPARVLTPHGTLVDVFTSEPVDPSMDLRRQRLEPYLRRAGFYYSLLIRRFEYDNPLISAFVEHGDSRRTCFISRGLGLPIDGEPISGTLRSWKLLGDVPPGHVGTTKYNIRLKWIRSRLQQMLLDAADDVMIQYARCYILYLLGSVLLPDKANTQSMYATYLCLPILMLSAVIVGGAHVFVGYIESCAWIQITPSKVWVAVIHGTVTGPVGFYPPQKCCMIRGLMTFLLEYLKSMESTGGKVT
ncbi:hypothetical protein Ahy_A06g029980 [Arachis hypogaea]|uniref:Aminotransferase-like plant mobile domain-containing protein n=1 Tax=Arachis hypogaea TaxID=3818 RepID=A0A445CUT7_ARAHY|nr:hypothetical protein Ahy_A06g029980 [Arachis hypogaea]